MNGMQSNSPGSINIPKSKILNQDANESPRKDEADGKK